MQNTYWRNEQRWAKTSLKKYTSHFIRKGLCVRGNWRLNKGCYILTSTSPPDIAVSRFRSPTLLNRGPEGPASLGHVLIPASSHQLVWSPNSIGSPEGPSAGWWLSQPHLVSHSSDLQVTDFLSPPSYIIVQSPTQSLEWHVWSSSSGNNCRCSSQVTLPCCISLWVYHGILPCPISSAKPAYAISSHNCHRNVSLPSGASLWNGMFDQVEGQYTAISV